MLKALVIKELRESAGIVALAALAAIYVLTVLTATPLLPWAYARLYHYPFISDPLTFYLSVVIGGLAIALGLRQTAWELGQSTFFFLLHRPIERGRVFGLKLVIGALLVITVAAATVLIYALWAASPGTFQAPFYWSMTAPAWQFCVAILPVYFGAFLSGIRPGRWFGSRLVPLVAGILVACVASMMPWFWLTVLVVIAGSAALVASIFYYVVERDY